MFAFRALRILNIKYSIILWSVKKNYVFNFKYSKRRDLQYVPIYIGTLYIITYYILSISKPYICRFKYSIVQRQGKVPIYL